MTQLNTVLKVVAVAVLAAAFAWREMHPRSQPPTPPATGLAADAAAYAKGMPDLWDREAAQVEAGTETHHNNVVKALADGRRTLSDPVLKDMDDSVKPYLKADSDEIANPKAYAAQLRAVSKALRGGR